MGRVMLTKSENLEKLFLMPPSSSVILQGYSWIVKSFQITINVIMSSTKEKLE